MSVRWKGRVLLIDDSEADVHLVQLALRDYSMAIDLVSVPDGTYAFPLLDEQHFDLVILDLNMPKVDGYAVLERYKPTYPPVVVFTSSWHDADSKRCLALGAKDFVRKPVSFDNYAKTVLAMVEKWCPGSSLAADSSE